jgi:tRNA 2-thiocytidine biosynthesis protein TtcA
VNALDPALSQPVMQAVEACVRRFELLPDGARVAVGISGGKDSAALWVAMRALQARQDFRFELGAVHLDQHQPGYQKERLDALCARLDIPLQVVSEDTWSVVSSQLEPGQIPCALCSRMRRGILNRWCAEQGFDVLALGHHLDDAIETFFLNLFFRRQLEPLKPATPADRWPVRTVRPLLLVEERRIVTWVERTGLVPAPCPVCDGIPDAQRRLQGELLQQMRALHPGLDASVRDALYQNPWHDLAGLPRTQPLTETQG